MEGNTPAPATEQPTTQQPEARPDHHINRQPRDFSGRVNGAPRPGAPAAKAAAPQGGEERQPGETAAEHQQRVKFKWTKSRAGNQVVEEEATLEDIGRWRSGYETMQEKFREAATLRKEADQIQKDFEEGLTKPSVMRKRIEDHYVRAGMERGEAREKAREVFAFGLADIIDEDEMDPRDKELREYRQREAQRQREEEERQSEAARAEFGKKVEAKRQEFTQRISAAMQAAAKGGLPVDEESMRVMGRHLLASMRHGVGCTEAELVAVYEADLDAGVGSRLKGLSFAQLKERYPELVRTVHAGLREQRVKQPGTPRPAPSVGTSRPAEPEPLRIASDDFEAYQKAMNERRGR